jgi:hypothetical protein
VLVGVAHVEERQVATQTIHDLVEADDELGVLPHAQAHRPFAGGPCGELAARCAPRREPPVQHAHSRVADVLQDPGVACRPHAGPLLVDHDRPVGGCAGVGVTHGHILGECREPFRARVQREHVVGTEIDGARNMAFGVVGGPARVDDHELATPGLFLQLPGLDQEIHSIPEKH